MERYFEWDKTKSEANFRKHNIRFEEASLIFNDPFALSEQDSVVHGEERWKTIGTVGGSLLLLVAHTVRMEEQNIEIVRIISARRVDKTERRYYENG